MAPGASFSDEEEVEDNGFLDEYDTDTQDAEAEEVVELTFDEKLAELDYAVTRQSLNRDILYNVLGFCQIEQPLNTIEAYIMERPDFPHATLSPYHLIRVLEKHHGVVEVDRDDDGEVVTAERLEGLTEDEVDDLIATIGFESTDVGMEFYQQHLPSARIAELMEEEAVREETFIELLRFCEETPRSYADISDLLKGREILTFRADGTPEKIQPSVFLDRLQRSGAVMWEEGWKTTEEGKEFLGRVG